jgi:thioesterase domain-containing protein
MFAQVEKLTGKNLPLVTLFQAPTIEQLAVLLRHEGWKAPWESLVAIRAGGSKPPLYGVHGVGGNILEFSDLAKYLDADQPLYGIQAQGLDGKKPLHTTVEEMAEHYIKEIREFQPEGPYYLGGSSFGGMVAYEMARRLVAAGERVGLVALFDTMAPGYPKFLPTTTAWKRRVNGWRFRFELHWSNFRVAEGREKWEYVWEKVIRLEREIVNQVKKRRKRIKNKIQRMFFPKGIKAVPKGGWEASSRYRPLPYTGTVTLFRATEQGYGIIEDRTNGWGPLALGGVEVIDVPGHHGSIMREPRAKMLARAIADAMARAQSLPATTPPAAESIATPVRAADTLLPDRSTFEPQGEPS